MIKLAKERLETKFGVFTEVLFYDGICQAVALIKGDIRNHKSPIVRIHSNCLSAHVFNSIECDCQIQMDFSQNLVSKEGVGIIIWLDQEGKSNGHLAKMLSTPYKDKGYTQEESYTKIGYKADARDYTFAKKILDYYGVHKVRLITNNPKKEKFIVCSGIEIDEIIRTPTVEDGDFY